MVVRLGGSSLDANSKGEGRYGTIEIGLVCAQADIIHRGETSSQRTTVLVSEVDGSADCIETKKTQS